MDPQTLLNNYRAKKQSAQPIAAATPSPYIPPTNPVANPQALLDNYRASQKSSPDQNIPANRNLFQKGLGIVLDPIAKLATETGQGIGKGILKGAELFQSPEQKARTEAGIKYAQSQGSNVPVLGTPVKPLKDVTAKDVAGQVISTAGVFTGNPALGGAALGFGGSLEQGNDVLSLQTAFETALGSVGGKVLDLIGKPLLDAAGKVIGKITPEYLKTVVAKGSNAISDFAANHSIIPKPVNNTINKIADLSGKANAATNKLFQGAQAKAKDIAINQFPESFGLLTNEGKIAANAKASENLATGLENKNPETQALYAKKQTEFHDNMRGILDKNPNIRVNAGITRAETKLKNLADRSGDPTSEQNVLNEIFDNGQLDGIKKDGTFATDNAQVRQTDKIKQNADLLNKQFSSSNHKIDGGSIGDSFVRDMNNKSLSNSEKISAENLRNDYPMLNKGAKPTPVKMYDLSKELRAKAYEARTGLIKDTAAADRYVNLAGKIDDYLRNSIPDINSAITKKLIDNQTRAYAARNVLIDLGKIKVPANIGRKISGFIGAFGGYTHAGWLGAGTGKIAAEKIFDATMEAFTNKQIASDVMRQFAENASKKEISSLTKIIEKNAAKNVRDKSIRDYYKKVSSEIASKTRRKLVGAKKFAEYGNVGTKYPQKLPEIQVGQPAKKLKSYLPTIK